MEYMLSVPVFCRDHGVSRSLFYRLLKQGQGPRLTKVARRTLISAEAAAEWRARMERQTEQAAPPAKASDGQRQGRQRKAATASVEAA